MIQVLETLVIRLVARQLIIAFPLKSTFSGTCFVEILSLQGSQVITDFCLSNRQLINMNKTSVVSLKRTCLIASHISFQLRDKHRSRILWIIDKTINSSFRSILILKVNTIGEFFTKEKQHSCNFV